MNTHTEAEVLGHRVGKLEDFERSEMLVGAGHKIVLKKTEISGWN